VIFAPEQVSEFWGLGLEPLAVSAISGSGTGDLMERLVAGLPAPKQAGEPDQAGPSRPLGVAIIGRPNVGKSSLLNSLVRAATFWLFASIRQPISQETAARTTKLFAHAISLQKEISTEAYMPLRLMQVETSVQQTSMRHVQIKTLTTCSHAPAAPCKVTTLLDAQVGEERSIVSAMSGTTRDAIDTEVVLPDGRAFTLIDTAGVRKRAQVADSADGAEPLSVNRALAAIRCASPFGFVASVLACMFILLALLQAHLHACFSSWLTCKRICNAWWPEQAVGPARHAWSRGLCMLLPV
jgi:predicted GTPase